MDMHYVFGMVKNFNGKPWTYAHYMAIKSAAVVNNPDHIYFWYEHEPVGEWWEQTKPYLTLKPILAPVVVQSRPVIHPAHKADVVRLQVLEQYGGVYCDCDVWCLRPFAELKHVGFWMGKQHEDYGLCNATMGGNPRASFVTRWLEEYKTFRSRGRDKYWDEHSVKLPYKLSRQYPALITVFDQFHFFEPTWRNVKTIFDGPSGILSRAYSVHLWETFSWSWLSKLTPATFDADTEIGQRLHAAGVL